MAIVFDMDKVRKREFKPGDIYLSFESTSPAELFGGNWAQITGRFLRMANDVNTGGSDNVTLTVNQIPSHTHTFFGANAGALAAAGGSFYVSSSGYSPTTETGGNGSHTNMPAYQDVYAWRKIS